MRAIKHALTERFYTWEDAVKLAENDPEVNLKGDGPAFTPSQYLEEGEGGAETAAEGEQEAAESAEKTAEKAEQTMTPAPDPATIPSPQAQSEAPRL